MSIHVYQVIALALTAERSWTDAVNPLSYTSLAEWFLTMFAAAALALAVILLFWVSAENRRTRQELTQKLTDSVAASAELRQKNYELTVDNRELRQRIAELIRDQQKVPEDITSAMNADEVDPNFGAFGG